MVAKDLFPFATVTDGCKVVKFMEFSHENGIFNTISLKVKKNIGKSVKLTSLQPPVMVEKGKISFAIVTHGYKAVIFDEIRLTFKNLYFSMNLAT